MKRVNRKWWQKLYLNGIYKNHNTGSSIILYKPYVYTIKAMIEAALVGVVLSLVFVVSCAMFG